MFLMMNGHYKGIYKEINMKANSVTYIGFVQDHSGSMRNNKILATNNYNEQRAKLLKEDEFLIR